MMSISEQQGEQNLNFLLIFVDDLASLLPFIYVFVDNFDFKNKLFLSNSRSWDLRNRLTPTVRAQFDGEIYLFPGQNHDTSSNKKCFQVTQNNDILRCPTKGFFDGNLGIIRSKSDISVINCKKVSKSHRTKTCYDARQVVFLRWDCHLT